MTIKTDYIDKTYAKSIVKAILHMPNITPEVTSSVGQSGMTPAQKTLSASHIAVTVIDLSKDLDAVCQGRTTIMIQTMKTRQSSQTATQTTIVAVQNQKEYLNNDYHPRKSHH